MRRLHREGCVSLGERVAFDMATVQKRAFQAVNCERKRCTGCVDVITAAGSSVQCRCDLPMTRPPSVWVVRPSSAYAAAAEL